jgi:hypothetical protein
MKTIEFQRSTPERSLRIQGWLIKVGERVGISGPIVDMEALRQAFDPDFTYPLCKDYKLTPDFDSIIGHAKLEMREDGIWVTGYIISGVMSKLWWDLLFYDLAENKIRFGFLCDGVKAHSCVSSGKGVFDDSIEFDISNMKIRMLTLGIGNLGGTVENMTFVEKGYE